MKVLLRGSCPGGPQGCACRLGIKMGLEHGDTGALGRVYRDVGAQGRKMSESGDVKNGTRGCQIQDVGTRNTGRGEAN